ncbi:MAG: uracil-DNA glycosylase [Pseudorhodobacter sp.]
MWPDIPATWAALPFFAQDWPALRERLDAEQGWQPPRDRVFRALTLTPRDRVRVVILGQDPYHTPGRATGLAFSFPPDTPPRDSLRNILTELEADLATPRASGDLTGWAEQGVLLLNTVLTVPVGAAHGHKRLGWDRLLSQVLAAVAGDGPRAFVLWGGPAQRLCRGLAREGHLFVETAHPSPLSAYRGFFGSRPFSRVNDWLTARGERAIDWAR